MSRVNTSIKDATESDGSIAESSANGVTQIGRWEIPTSWHWSTAGDIADIVSGGTPPSKDPNNFTTDGIPWITPADLTGYEETYITKGARDLTEQGLNFSSAKIVPEGTVLYTSRAPIGYCSIAANPISTNQGFKNLVLTNDVVPEFARHYLLASKDYAESLASGTTFKELSGARMKILEIPLAPKAEQTRIVKKIESLQSRTSKTRALLEEVKPLIAQLRQSVLRSAFNGSLTADWRAKQHEASSNGSSIHDGANHETASELLQRIRVERRQRWEAAQLAAFEAKGKKPNKGWRDKYKEPEPVDETSLPELPEGWCWETLEAMVPFETPIVYGIIQAGPHVSGGVPYVRPADIKDSAIEFENLLRTTPEIASKYHRAALKPGDLIFSVVGTIGKTLIVDKRLDGANITQSSVRIRMFKPYSSTMILRALQSPLVTQQMERMQFGNAVQRLNVEHMRRLAIPVPPLLEWQLISAKIESGFSNLAKLEKNLASMQSSLSRLDQSILSKAFRGELAPQDPNDEPAYELLARIRAEREATTVKKKS